MFEFVRTGLARAKSPRIWVVQARYCSENVQLKQVSTLRPAVMADYISFPNSKLHSLIWHKPLQNVFVTKKPVTKKTKDAMVEFITHMHDSYPEINVIVQPHIAEEIKHEFKSKPKSCPDHPHVLYVGEDSEIVEKTDLLVSLGGDGTILHAVSMFSHLQVPPVLAFSLGTLGFLLPFDFKEFKEVFENILHSRAKCLHRPRLLCHLVRNGQVELSRRMYSMNDIFIHRGNSPHLAQMEVFVGNEYLTTTVADGVVIATPTGSTAYSLSAGGSIVSPLVPSILLTPICPRSLSFRPVILPCSSHIKVVIGRKPSQGPGAQVLKLSIDGIPQRDLHPGDEIHVVNEVGTIYINGAQVPPVLLQSDNSKPIRHPGIFCVAKAENDWIRGINELLGFNSGFRAHSKQ